MKKIGLAVIAGLTLSACVDFKGSLQVYDELKFNVGKKGKERTLSVPVGHRSAKVEVVKKNGNKKILLKFDKRGKGKKVEFRVPPGTPLPKWGGRFNYPASQVQQNYDVSGVVDTQVSESSIYHTSESCSKTITRRVCDRVRVPQRCRVRRDGRRVCHGGGYERRCSNRSETVYGRKDVEYYDRYTTKSLNFALSQPGTNHVAGEFSGSDSKSERIYVYEGPCRLNRW